jgi:predicted membrane-bound spermidine synthase
VSLQLWYGDSEFFGEIGMFDVRDLFQWERFITPAIIRVFYTLVVIVAVMIGISGVISALQLMQVSPFAGIATAFASVLAACMAILGTRIGCEFVLIMFRMNDHLGVLRSRAEM